VQKRYNSETLEATQQSTTSQGKEINFTAMMMVREILGWSQKKFLFTGETLSQLLKQLTTRDGKALYGIMVEENGAVKKEYMVWLNNRPIKEEHSLEITLNNGDRVLVTSMIKFAAGG